MIDVTASGPFMVIIDPCHGEPGEGMLPILVHGVLIRRPLPGSPVIETEDCRAHIGWGSAALLSPARAQAFADGIKVALEIAAEMERDCGYHRFTERHLSLVKHA